MCPPLFFQLIQKKFISLSKWNAYSLSACIYILPILMLSLASSFAYAQVTVGRWDRFEKTITNPNSYGNAYRDVTLDVTYTKPDGSSIDFWGFYDENFTWRIRFMPDQLGEWTYQASFSDGTPGATGTFTCVPSSIPGMISKDETNPRWFGFTGGKHTLIRSFHGGPPLLAYNFPDTERTSFLDWVNQQGYNMLSVNDFQETGYTIPNLWPLSAYAFRQVEKVLNELATRQIIFYSFGGLLPRDESIPGSEEDESLLVKYYLARLAPYWNILLNVSGTEANYDAYITSTKVSRVGAELKKRDVFGHLIGNHNQDGDDPYRNQVWAGYATLQVEITDLYSLNTYLLRNHTGTKPVYAQENLWPGNTLQPSGSFDAATIRKHAWVHMLSATALNFGDMNGKNNSGFSGTLNLADKIQARHAIVDKVWDFMEIVPFYKLNPSQSLVTNGFCLAEPGQQYLVYLPAKGAVDIAVQTGKMYEVKWINGQNPLTDQRSGGITATGQDLSSPTDGDDWLVYLTADNSPSHCSATGSILREYWANVKGGDIADIPINSTPASSTQINSFQTPSGIGDNYGQRIRGYICAPASGSYTFYLASDDKAALWLSTNDNPASKQKIASLNAWTNPKQWTKYPSQKSVAITLEKGKKYYVEALHKEAIYGDNLAVGWTIPGSSSIQVIPGSVLSPFVPSAARLASEEDTQQKGKLVVYPNPFEDNLTIATGEQQGKVLITLTDVVGKTYFTKQYQLTAQSEIKLDIPDLGLKKGMYLLKLQAEDGQTQVFKVVKK